MSHLASLTLSLLALCGLFASASADAAVLLLRVGADAACDYRTDTLPNALQSAIDAVPTTIPAGDAYVIRVARNGSYSGNKYLVTNRNLSIEGGYATCSSPTAGSDNTELDAAGAEAGAALHIYGGAAMRRNVVLQRLTVKNGAYSGIYITLADVRLERVTVRNNTGTLGGGIYVGFSSSLRLYGNSAVLNNTATSHGGGIYCMEGSTIWLESASAVIGNTTTGIGGGIMLSGCQATVNSGATGIAGLGVNIGTNEASRGGGIALLSSSKGPDTVLVIGRDLLGSDPRPLIVNNHASIEGGGIYAAGSRTRVEVRDATIGSNTAAFGGGIMAGSGAQLEVTRTLRQCGGAQACSRIINNEANWGGGVGVEGAGTFARVSGTRLEGNRASAGGSAYYVAQGEAELWSMNNVIVGNTGASAVEISPGFVVVPRTASVELFSDTLAGNSGGAAVINANAEGHVSLTRTIIHADPALPVLRRTGSPVEAQAQMHCNMFHVITGVNDRDPLTKINNDPGFIDAASGNYHLSPDAWAIDLCPSLKVTTFDIDHDLHLRPVNSPLPDIHGPFDVGAYEWNPSLFQDGFED